MKPNIFSALVAAFLLPFQTQAQCPVMVVGDSSSAFVLFESFSPDSLGGGINLPIGASTASSWFRIGAGVSSLDHGIAYHNLVVQARNGTEFAWQDSLYVREFLQGDTLSAPLRWRNDYIWTGYYSMDPIPQPGSGAYPPSGALTWDSRIYLGFRVPAGNGYRYGWIEFEPINHNPGLQVRLLRYAIHDCVYVNAEPEASGLMFSLSPVPAQDRVGMRLAGAPAGAWYLRLYDVQGRTVLQQSGDAPQGSFTGDISLEGLAPGLYHAEVVLESTGEVLRQKLLVR